MSYLIDQLPEELRVQQAENTRSAVRAGEARIVEGEVAPGMTEPCWLWLGSSINGHGRVGGWFGSKSVLVRRLVRHLLVGDIAVFTEKGGPRTTSICGTKHCCHPLHTEENRRD